MAHRPHRRRFATIPATLTDAITAVTTLLNQFFTLISGMIFPATLTPVSVLAAFGVIFPIVGVVMGFVFSLVRGRS
jgi:hypothetical protein